MVKRGLRKIRIISLPKKDLLGVLNRIRRDFLNLDVYAMEKKIDKLHKQFGFTCDDCCDKTTCKYVYDFYCTNGECLGEK